MPARIRKCGSPVKTSAERSPCDGQHDAIGEARTGKSATDRVSSKLDIGFETSDRGIRGDIDSLGHGGNCREIASSLVLGQSRPCELPSHVGGDDAGGEREPSFLDLPGDLRPVPAVREELDPCERINGQNQAGPPP